MKNLRTLVIMAILILQSPVAKAGWWDDFVDWAMSPKAGASVRSFHLLKVKNNNE